MSPAHKRMSKLLSYCLTAADPSVWPTFIKAAKLVLTDQERGTLAYAALKALNPDQAAVVVNHALGGNGQPIPHLISEMDSARDWANLASKRELKAYALASYEALPPAEQMRFRNFISEVAI